MMNNITNIKLTDGASLHLIKAEKFKTNLLSLYLKFPLSRDNATKSALLPMVLRRGTKNYPSLSSLAKHCEELYGASMYSGLRKKGDSAFLYFSLEFVSDEYISESILKDATEFLKEFVFNPKTENLVFDERFVNSEKNNLRDNIRSIINDKKEYADQRIKEISFPDGSYGISPYGFEEDLENITPENLYEYYEYVIKNSKIDIFLSGTFEDDTAIELIKNTFSECIKPRNPEILPIQIATRKKGAEIKRVTEKMDVTQSKLCIAMYTNTEPFSKEFYATFVFNCIYGGSPFSKLFNNVREKYSLAYYVSSRLDRQKGCMLISSGIENDKFDAAYNEIMLWLDNMKAGDFSDEEILSAKKYLETNINSIIDSLRATEDYLLPALSDERTPETPEELINNLKSVTRNDIIEAAGRVELDSVYLLTGKDN